MKEIVNTSALYRARNAGHYQVHGNILEVITEEFANAMELGPLRTVYANNYQEEKDCFKQNRRYQETELIVADDKERDDHALFLWQSIDMNRRSPVPEISEAATRAYYVVEPYLGSSRLNYTDNTGAISAMLEKLALPENAADIATLGLTTTVALLTQKNESFNALHIQRSTELNNRLVSQKMTEIRPRVDSSLVDLIKAINALELINELITKDPERKAALEAVIDVVNGILAQLMKDLAGQSGHVEGDDTPDIQPDDTPDTGDDTPGTEGGNTPDENGTTTPPTGDNGDSTEPPGTDDDEEVVG